MQRDAERVDRFSRAVGPEMCSTLTGEWEAIASAQPIQHSFFRDIATACRRANVPPEAMLVAVRTLSRALFDHATPEAQRIETAWNDVVRTMMDGYYTPEPLRPD